MSHSYTVAIFLPGKEMQACRVGMKFYAGTKSHPPSIKMTKSLGQKYLRGKKILSFQTNGFRCDRELQVWLHEQKWDCKFSFQRLWTLSVCMVFQQWQEKSGTHKQQLGEWSLMVLMLFSPTTAEQVSVFTGSCLYRCISSNKNVAEKFIYFSNSTQIVKFVY